MIYLTFNWKIKLSLVIFSMLSLLRFIYFSTQIDDEQDIVSTTPTQAHLIFIEL